MYALVDCNNFYASCERVFRPELRDKPIVVLSNNDGCVIARSSEAKDLGIPMGAPAFEYQARFEQYGVYVFSSNFALYGDMSHRVMQILQEYSPEVEVYSIDEIFLKLTGFEHFDLDRYGAEMRQKVLKYTGIPISVGIAPTKSLAKVANKIAKKFQERTQGTYLIDSEEKKIKALNWLKVEDIWGVGRKFAKKLKNYNVHTALEFIKLDDVWVRKYMSVVGLRLKLDLSGQSVLTLEDIKPKKNIAVTRSFERNYTELSDLKERVATFAVIGAERLRKQKSACKSMLVFIHTNRFRKDLPQRSANILVHLPFATHSAIELAKYAQIAVERLYLKGYSYKKAGVILQDFIPEQHVELNLFEKPDERHSLLMKHIDKLNEKFGMQKIKLAAQDVKRVWKMNQNKRSANYTTDLNQIITIRV
ncbi:MAG: Y-family DNA polymerase [Chitinophagales bacterium]|nr:Y-family DNA polymerase [Chitinophagales bacterium]